MLGQARCLAASSGAGGLRSHPAVLLTVAPQVLASSPGAGGGEYHGADEMRITRLFVRVQPVLNDSNY